jgi:hypothetical protein
MALVATLYRWQVDPVTVATNSRGLFQCGLFEHDEGLNVMQKVKDVNN